MAIHQPRPEVWDLFSHTILLLGGKIVFCGQADRALPQVARCNNVGQEKLGLVSSGYRLSIAKYVAYKIDITFLVVGNAPNSAVWLSDG